MNKKHFLTSILFNVVSALLFIEHLAGLELAFGFLIGWTIFSLIVHIHILSQYIVIGVEIEEKN